MEKQLRQRSSSISYENNHHGCMGGVIHLFNFPRRFRPRRMLLDRRHRRHGDASGFGYVKVNQDIPSTVDEHGFVDDETNYIIGDETKASGTSQEEGGILPSQIRLTRTLSIHHWECNDYVEKSSETIAPAQLEKNSGSLNDENSAGHKQITEVKDCYVRNCTAHTKEQKGENFAEDFLTPNLHNTSNETVLKLPQDQSPDSVLTKCGSYPGARSTTKYTMFSGLKSRRKDTKSFVKQKESQALGKESAVEGQKGDNAVPFINSMTSSVTTSDSENQHKDVMTKENMKEKYRISLDRILHKIPYGHKIPHVMMVEKLPAPDRNGKPNFGRSRSLTESIDRYSLLLESNISKESKRDVLNRSKSVHDDGSFPYMHRSKTLGRLTSLREFEPHFSEKNAQSEASHGLSFSRTLLMNLNVFEETKIKGAPGNPKGVLELSGTVYGNQGHDAATVDNVSRVDVVQGEEAPSIESDADASETSGLQDELLLDGTGGSPSIEEFDPQVGNSYNRENQSSLPNPDSCFEEDLINPAKSSVSEENSKFKGDSKSFEQDSSLSHSDNSFFLTERVQMYSKMEDDFNYVREVLKKSGLDGNKLSKLLDTPEQPVDFSVFEELEGSKCLLDIGIYVPDINLDHLLLFDLINEVLLEIHSSTLSPWISCFGYRIPRIATESRVLKEVWANISWHSNYHSQLNFSLEHIVARDLSKNDQWMDIRHETKIMGWEIEALIFDDLLDEAITQL